MKKILLLSFFLIQTIQPHNDMRTIIRHYLYTHLESFSKLTLDYCDTQKKEFLKIFSALTKFLCDCDNRMTINRKNILQILTQETIKLMQDLDKDIEYFNIELKKHKHKSYRQKQITAQEETQ